MKLSRSALYARAVEEFVKRNAHDDLTAEINRALAEDPDEPDPFVMSAAEATLRRVEWKK